MLQSNLFRVCTTEDVVCFKCDKSSTSTMPDAAESIACYLRSLDESKGYSLLPCITDVRWWFAVPDYVISLLSSVARPKRSILSDVVLTKRLHTSSALDSPKIDFADLGFVRLSVEESQSCFSFVASMIAYVFEVEVYLGSLNSCIFVVPRIIETPPPMIATPAADGVDFSLSGAHRHTVDSPMQMSAYPMHSSDGTDQEAGTNANGYSEKVRRYQLPMVRVMIPQPISHTEQAVMTSPSESASPVDMLMHPSNAFASISATEHDHIQSSFSPPRLPSSLGIALSVDAVEKPETISRGHMSQRAAFDVSTNAAPSAPDGPMEDLFDTFYAASPKMAGPFLTPSTTIGAMALSPSGFAPTPANAPTASEVYHGRHRDYVAKLKQRKAEMRVRLRLDQRSQLESCKDVFMGASSDFGVRESDRNTGSSELQSSWVSSVAHSHGAPFSTVLRYSSDICSVEQRVSAMTHDTRQDCVLRNPEQGTVLFSYVPLLADMAPLAVAETPFEEDAARTKQSNRMTPYDSTEAMCLPRLRPSVADEEWKSLLSIAKIADGAPDFADTVQETVSKPLFFAASPLEWSSNHVAVSYAKSLISRVRFSYDRDDQLVDKRWTLPGIDDIPKIGVAVEATTLNAPNILVGFKNELLATNPTIIPFWTQCGLQPFCSAFGTGSDESVGLFCVSTDPTSSSESAGGIREQGLRTLVSRLAAECVSCGFGRFSHSSVVPPGYGADLSTQLKRLNVEIDMFVGAGKSKQRAVCLLLDVFDEWDTASAEEEALVAMWAAKGVRVSILHVSSSEVGYSISELALRRLAVCVSQTFGPAFVVDDARHCRLGVTNVGVYQKSMFISYSLTTRLVSVSDDRGEFSLFFEVHVGSSGTREQQTRTFFSGLAQELRNQWARMMTSTSHHAKTSIRWNVVVCRVDSIGSPSSSVFPSSESTAFLVNFLQLRDASFFSNIQTVAFVLVLPSSFAVMPMTGSSVLRRERQSGFLFRSSDPQLRHMCWIHIPDESRQLLWRPEHEGCCSLHVALLASYRLEFYAAPQASEVDGPCWVAVQNRDADHRLSVLDVASWLYSLTYLDIRHSDGQRLQMIPPFISRVLKFRTNN